MDLELGKGKEHPCKTDFYRTRPAAGIRRIWLY